MPRVLLTLLVIAVNVYALADIVRCDEDETPGRLPKGAWIILVVLTAPALSLGALAWIVLRLVARAEAGTPATGRGASGGAVGGRGLRERLGAMRNGTDGMSHSPVAPDDDPEFLFRLERDLQRQRRARAHDASDDAPTPREGATLEAQDPTTPREDGNGPSAATSAPTTGKDGTGTGTPDTSGDDDATDEDAHRSGTPGV